MIQDVGLVREYSVLRRILGYEYSSSRIATRPTPTFETIFKGPRILGDDVSHSLKINDYLNGYCLYSLS